MVSSSAQPLSLAFMRAHPERAARVLEALPAEAVADLFLRAPARLSADVLAAMLPHSAVRCLALLDEQRVQQLLAPLGTQPVVALLRCMEPAHRQALVASLPTSLALASSLLLGYAEDSLGALADPDVLSLPPHTTAGEALQRLQAAATEQVQLFVADTDRRLAGTVSLPALLRAPASTRLLALMKPPTAVLAANAPVSGAAAHPGWERASSLPVVEVGDRLMGVLSREALARALRHRAPQTARAGSADDGLPALFARGYWQLFSGALEAALALTPPVAPVAGPDAGAIATKPGQPRRGAA